MNKKITLLILITFVITQIVSIPTSFAATSFSFQEEDVIEKNIEDVSKHYSYVEIVEKWETESNNITIYPGTQIYGIIDGSSVIVDLDDEEYRIPLDKVHEVTDMISPLPVDLKQEQMEQKILDEDTTFYQQSKVDNDKEIKAITLKEGTEVNYRDLDNGLTEYIFGSSKFYIYEDIIDSNIEVVTSLEEEQSITEENEIEEEQPITEENEIEEEQPITEENEIEEEQPITEENEIEEEQSIAEENEIEEEQPIAEENEIEEEQPITEENEIDVEESKAAKLSIAQTKSINPWLNINTKYFEVTKDKLEVYDNRKGYLELIGTIEKGQQFPRVSDYGNWHKIQFGDYYGYVLKSGTIPISHSSMKNENTKYSTEGREFTVLKNTIVYDNTSGKLVPYATIHKGTKATIATDYGNWWRVIIGGKIGYLLKEDVKVTFNANDKYFQVIEENLEVYDNRKGYLELIGTLKKGQIFPRTRDYGNWHQIQFGNYYGYVLKSGTTLSDGTGLRNENKTYSTTGREFTVARDTVIYDNTSGKLVPYATIHKGTKATIATDYGNWWRVIIGGKIGYLLKEDVKVTFNANDKYFQVIEENLEVYDNRKGYLELIGTLKKGQIFPRTRDYGNWHQIQFGNYYGYVLKGGTTLSDGTGLRNENKTYSTTGREFTVARDTVIYDNTSGKLVPYATIHKGTKATIATDYGNWWRVIIGGKIGYLLKKDVGVSFVKSDKYMKAVKEAPVYFNDTGSLVKAGELVIGQDYEIGREYGNWWEIDFAGKKGYVLKSDMSAEVSPMITNKNTNFSNNGTFIKVIEEVIVYDNTSGKLVPFAKIEPGTSYPIVSEYGNWWRIILHNRVGYILKSKTENSSLKITNYNLAFNSMVDIQMRATPKSDGAGKIAATRSEVAYYLNPMNFAPDSSSYFQFLLLDQPTNVSAWEINEKFLKTYTQAGTLQGQGQAFVDAAKKYGINEIYLIAHTLHETGNGKGSSLALGVSEWTKMKPNSCQPELDEKGNPIKMKINYKVYNMYGVKAFDDCPTNAGAQYAYEQGWTTPAKAVLGGAYFIKEGYINRGQNTLYKMRWDPDYAAKYNRYGKQYATHIAWADIQAKSIASMYKDLTGYFLQFDEPKFYNQPGSTSPPEDGNNQTPGSNSTLPVKTVGKTTVDLNMRSMPSKSSTSIKVLPAQTKLEVIVDNGDGWYSVKEIGKSSTGWIYKNTNTNPYFDFLNLYKVNVESGSTLSVRSAPSTSGTILGKLSNNEQISVVLDSNNNVVNRIADNYTWYQVYYNGDTAWTASNFLTKIN